MDSDKKYEIYENDEINKNIDLYSDKIIKSVNQETYINSFVGFIDILGFKTIMKNESNPDKIKNLFSNIISLKNEISKMYIAKNIPVNNIKINIMSDSIVLSIDNTIKNSFLALLQIFQMIINIFLEQEEVYFARGSIAEGDIYQNDDIVFGPALVDAYLLQEKNANFPRFIVTPKVKQNAIINLENVYKGVVNDFMTIDSEDMFYNVHYLRNRILQLITKKDFEYLYNYLLRIQKVIITKIESETIETVRRKYLWLMNYFDNTISEIKEVVIDNSTYHVEQLRIKGRFY